MIDAAGVFTDSLTPVLKPVVRSLTMMPISPGARVENRLSGPGIAVAPTPARVAQEKASASVAQPDRGLERFAHRSPWTSSPQIVLFARR